jgi:hypothetical protein
MEGIGVERISRLWSLFVWLCRQFVELQCQYPQLLSFQTL